VGETKNYEKRGKSNDKLSHETVFDSNIYNKKLCRNRNKNESGGKKSME
jgi:hypothetical protein